MKQIKRIKQMGENSRIVIKNVIGAFTIKGLSLIISFITTPIFIQYFDNNKVLGVWYTLLSVLLWFLNFDLGLGNGIRNNLVKALTEKDYNLAKKVISSGMFSIGIVTILLAFLGCILINSIDLGIFFNIDTKIVSTDILSQSTIYVFIAIMLRFFLTSISSVFYALQKSAINNLLALCVSCLQLLYILVVNFDTPEEALLNISFAYIFLSNVPIILAGIIVFYKKMKECRPSLMHIDIVQIKAIMNIGMIFFLCQLLYMLIANTNEFFVTYLYGSEYTAEYTFYYKLSSLGTMVVSLALTPVWSVVTKSQAEGNYIWLNKLYKYIKLSGLGILLLQLTIVPFVPYIMDLWLGKGVIQVSYSTATGFAIFGGIFLYSGMLSTIANGLTMLRIQTISYFFAVILKIVILLVFSEYTNWDFIIWVNILILLPYIITQQHELNKFFINKI